MDASIYALQLAAVLLQRSGLRDFPVDGLLEVGKQALEVRAEHPQTLGRWKTRVERCFGIWCLFRIAMRLDSGEGFDEVYDKFLNILRELPDVLEILTNLLLQQGLSCDDFEVLWFQFGDRFGGQYVRVSQDEFERRFFRVFKELESLRHEHEYTREQFEPFVRLASDFLDHSDAVSDEVQTMLESWKAFVWNDE